MGTFLVFVTYSLVLTGLGFALGRAWDSKVEDTTNDCVCFNADGSPLNQCNECPR